MMCTFLVDARQDDVLGVTRFLGCDVDVPCGCLTRCCSCGSLELDRSISLMCM